MAEPIDPAQSPARPAASMLRCFRCHYDLSATPADANCPECGLSVWTSADGYRLCRCASPHLRSLILGTRLIRAGLLALAAVMVWLFLASEVSVELGSPFVDAATSHWITALIVILLPRDIATGMVLIGLWFVSRTDEISMIGRSRRHGLIPVSLTSTLRAGIVLLVASGIASSIIGLVLSANMREWLYAPVRSESWDRLTLVLDLSSVATAIGAFVVVVGGLLCLSRLAGRLPDQVMARRFRRWAWLLPLLFVVGAVPSLALLDGDYELVGSAVTVLVYVALLIQSSRLTKSLGNRIKALASESSPNREPSPAVANHT